MKNTFFGGTMKVEYTLDQHEKLLKKIIIVSNRGLLFVKFGILLQIGWFVIALLLTFAGNIDIHVGGALGEFLESQIGNILCRIITFVWMFAIWYFLLRRRISAILTPVKLACESMLLAIQEKRYSVVRTMCIDRQTMGSNVNGQRTTDIFFTLEGYEKKFEFKAPSELVSKGDMVDLIAYDNEIFVIKAL